MRKIIAKELKIKFIEVLSELENFSYEEGNPFLIKIGSKRYFVFLKNLSPAYFKNSPDITRVQLPYSPHFAKILSANIPFIILGYNVDSDIFVSWNPKNIKERLNAKANVSLYSRESLQSKVKRNEFKDGYLSNGEKIILFKRESLTDFFDNYHALFSKHGKQEEIEYDEPIEGADGDFTTDKVYEITDQVLLAKIEPLLKKNKVLEAVEITAKHFGKRYKNMDFKDWFKLVNSLYKKQ